MKAIDDFPAANVRNPSYGMKTKAVLRVNRIQFGDGYMQEGPAGINSVNKSFSLEWKYLSHTEANQLEDFLNDHAGRAARFTWTHPLRGTRHLVVCTEGAQREDNDHVTATITATFEERFA